MKKKKSKSDAKNISKGSGVIVQVIGAVVDVEFPDGILPSLYDALTVSSEYAEGGTLVLEVAAHLSDNRVVLCHWVRQMDSCEIRRYKVLAQLFLSQ